MFRKKGYLVHIASIAGGKVPVDPLSTSAPNSRLGPMRRFLGSREPPCAALFYSMEKLHGQNIPAQILGTSPGLGFCQLCSPLHAQS